MRASLIAKMTRVESDDFLTWMKKGDKAFAEYTLAKEQLAEANAIEEVAYADLARACDEEEQSTTEDDDLDSCLMDYKIASKRADCAERAYEETKMRSGSFGEYGWKIISSGTPEIEDVFEYVPVDHRADVVATALEAFNEAKAEKKSAKRYLDLQRASAHELRENIEERVRLARQCMEEAYVDAETAYEQYQTAVDTLNECRKPRETDPKWMHDDFVPTPY